MSGVLNMKSKNYNMIVASLECWIDSWCDNNGRYNGPVVHRRDLKRLKNVHNTPWSQAEIINAYINIYRKTGSQECLQKAISAANAQMSNLLETGEYKFAGYEDDRFSSLVHNALADCALLNLAQLLREQNLMQSLSNELICCVRKNVEKYFIGCLYEPEIGAFKFNRVDYYSVEVNRCVCNMNAIAAEAMVRLSYLCEELELSKYINDIGIWIKRFINKSTDINRGAISYSHTQENVYISIYTALALRGICFIYDYNHDEELLEGIKNTVDNLITFMDKEMFMHESNNGTIYSKPWFISGSGMILSAIYQAKKYLNTSIDDEKYLKPFLKYQLPNGAFQNFIGYDSCGNRLSNKHEGVMVWEDIFPTLGWNAQMFAYLSNYVTKEFVRIEKRDKNIFLKKTFFYYENMKNVIILSWFPLRSVAFIKYKKGKEKANIAFTLLDFTRKLRGLK